MGSRKLYSYFKGISVPYWQVDSAKLNANRSWVHDFCLLSSDTLDLWPPRKFIMYLEVKADISDQGQFVISTHYN